MASKPFYSMDEVCEKLGKSADEIKGLVREGTLREFRDAGKIFFKAEDIERLASGGEDSDVGADVPERPTPADMEPGDSGGDLDLAPVDEAAPPDTSEDESSDADLTELADAAGGTSIIGLEPLDDEEAPPPPPQEEKQAEQPPAEEKEDTVITASGIGVFDDDELEIDADPMAKTQITESQGDDQVSLEGAGSGSGLLDLAREADDTALGADLLDEIYPGEEEGEGAATTEEPEAEAAEAEPEVEAPAAEEEEPEVAEAEPTVLEEAAPMAATAPAPAAVAAASDPLEGLLTGLLVGGLIVMGVAATVVAAVIQGVLPWFGRYLGDGSKFYFFLGGSVLLAVITLLVGWFVSKAFAPKRR